MSRRRDRHALRAALVMGEGAQSWAWIPSSAFFLGADDLVDVLVGQVVLHGQLFVIMAVEIPKDRRFSFGCIFMCPSREVEQAPYERLSQVLDQGERYLTRLDFVR